MVKQYRDGYFENGKWHNGTYHDPNYIINTFQVREGVFDRHTRPITPEKICKINDTFDGIEWIDYDNTLVGYATGNYTEPIDTPYIQYILMGAVVVLLMAIIFMIALTIF